MFLNVMIHALKNWKVFEIEDKYGIKRSFNRRRNTKEGHDSEMIRFGMEHRTD